MPEEKQVFIEPSASGPSQRVTSDGVVLPGKAHEAREGRVTNPGVRSVGTTATSPRCPQCGNPTLKMRMNKPVGQRIYCSNKEGCGYDSAKQDRNAETINVNPSTKIVDKRGRGGKGVKIVRQSGPR